MTIKTLNKPELATRIVARLKAGEVPTAFPTQTAVENTLNAMCEEIVAALLSGTEINLHGLGKLKLVQKDARIGRNPSTGAVMNIGPKLIVKLHPALSLKNALAEKASA